MTDSLLLQGIRVWTRIGVADSERSTAQELTVTVELFHPTKDVAKTDDLAAGIDYAAVTQSIIELAKTERRTIERFAEDIAAMILKTYKPHAGVKVSVRKSPADLPTLGSATVTIIRP